MFDIAALDAAGWAFSGIVITKAADFLMNRRKTDSDKTVATYNAVNDAQKQLVDSLFAQVKMQGEEIAEMRKQLLLCEKQHHESAVRTDYLQREVIRLKAALTETNGSDKR